MQQFGDNYACGLELLALRRGKHKGSITHIAEQLYAYIRAGGDNLTKQLNLTRSSKALKKVRKKHFAAYVARKRKLRDQLFQTINAKDLSEEECLTGLFLSGEEIIRIDQET